MADDRDFLYAKVVVGFRQFVTDDKRFGLHLKMGDGETLDVVFHNPLAYPDLQKLCKSLQRHLPEEP